MPVSRSSWSRRASPHGPPSTSPRIAQRPRSERSWPSTPRTTRSSRSARPSCMPPAGSGRMVPREPAAAGGGDRRPRGGHACARDRRSDVPGASFVARLVEVLATAPARIAGMYPRKGVIAVGSDADVVVFDPGARRVEHAAELHSACDYDPYEGWDVTGWPEVVLSRGEVVFERGTVTARPGRGQFVPRGRYGES